MSLLEDILDRSFSVSQEKIRRGACMLLFFIEIQIILKRKVYVTAL